MGGTNRETKTETLKRRNPKMQVNRKYGVVGKRKATNVHIFKINAGHVAVAQIGRVTHQTICYAATHDAQGYKDSKNAARRVVRANYEKAGRTYA